MAEVVLFHHAQGQTPGFHRLAQVLRDAGHVVHTPDLFDGRVFPSVQDGIAYVEQDGFDALVARGVAAADDLPNALVYAGFSLGVLPAQKLAQTRPGARAALLFASCVEVAHFADAWPAGVAVQVHGMDRDPFFAGEGDIDAARELVEQASDSAEAELYVYPGDAHLFADSSLASYDADAARLLTQRVLDFLRRLPPE